MSTEFPRRRIHGRRQGHKLSPRKQRLMAEMLPGLQVGVGTGETCDLARLFAHHHRDIWLEIGFGAGEHLIAQARAHPDINFIGCERFINGVAKLLTSIEDHDLGNIRIHDDDAHDLLDHLPDASIARVFLLFPDPWPKTRHHKRRFVSDENLDRIARILGEDGVLRIASDIDDYIFWIIRHLDRHPAFDWEASSSADWNQRPPGWPPTRYEQRAIEAGRRPRYLSFRRKRLQGSGKDV